MKYLILFLIISLIVGCLVWKVSKFKVTETLEISLGPFECKGKNLMINLKYHVNNIEGAKYLTQLEVEFGRMKLNRIGKFAQQFNENKQLMERYSSFDRYLESEKNVLLPSQEELIERNIRPDESYMESIATDGSADEKEISDFINCFNLHKKTIYDQIAGGSLTKTPKPLFFYKAYFLEHLNATR